MSIQPTKIKELVEELAGSRYRSVEITDGFIKVTIGKLILRVHEDEDGIYIHNYIDFGGYVHEYKSLELLEISELLKIVDKLHMTIKSM